MWHAFLHYTGADNPSGPWYGFWSGVGSIIIQPTMFVGGLVFLRHKNCHVRGCWRLGHTDPEHGHPACRNHHSLAHKL